jgi:hypothetical protein
MWLYHRKQDPTVNDEIVFLHGNTLRVSFNKSDIQILIIENLVQSVNIIKVKVPFNRWVFLQI